MDKKITKNTGFYTTNEVAKILGISHVAVYKKIQKGRIKGYKIGRNFVIPASELAGLRGGELSASDKKLIEEAVKKTVKEYGTTLKLLGAE